MKFGLYTLIIESHFPKISIFTFDKGYGNGYVLLPPEHPYYGLDDDSLDILVHGGLTYTQEFNSENFENWVKDRDFCGDINLDNYNQFNGYWIIGFDTNHYGDNEYNCSKEMVINETEYLLEQCLNDSNEKLRKYKIKFLRKNKLLKININII